VHLETSAQCPDNQHVLRDMWRDGLLHLQACRQQMMERQRTAEAPHSDASRPSRTVGDGSCLETLFSLVDMACLAHC
jgi:hypothetical protein